MARASQASFRIAYTGPALAEHMIDVRQLGPALLAVGDLCREANRVINKDRTQEVNVLVKANFQEACFDISFEFVQQLYQQVKGLIQDEDVATAKDILEWLGFLGVITGGSLLGFLKWKRGRKITNIEQNSSGAGGTFYNISIEGDDNKFQLSAPVYNLFRDPQVRAAQRRIVAPLENEGFEQVEIREDEKVINTMTREEYEQGSYDIQEGEVEGALALEPQKFRAILTLISPVFLEKNKWRFSLGRGQRISATIKDANFLIKVFKLGERFGVGDTLEVTLSMMQTLGKDGVYRTEYEIIEVHKINMGPQQLNFLSDDEM